MEAIESLEFRTHARANCYRYGPLYMYSENMNVCLDEHGFPSYGSSSDTGGIEKLLSLVSSRKALSNGVDAAKKLAKPLPGVQWEGDSLEWSLSISGRMYLLSYRDFRDSVKNIKQEILKQGWTVYDTSVVGLPAQSYIPNRSGEDALFNEDPVDAANRAMLTSATNRLVDQVKLLAAGVSGNVELYSDAVARSEVSGSFDTPGFIGTFMDAAKALTANLNAGMAGKWRAAGAPVELLVDGRTIKRGLNAVMTSLSLTEGGYVVDASSSNVIYPTYLDVTINVKNMYGKLENSSHNE